MNIIEQPEGSMKDPIAQLDEYDVHDLFATAICTVLRECSMNDTTRTVHEDVSGCYDHVVIVPRDPERFTKDLVEKYEQKVNELFKNIRELDAMIHVDAEYTC